MQVAQRATDFDATTAFYAELLGVEPVATFDPPGLAFFDLEGIRLLMNRNAPSALIYLPVDDIDAAVAGLREKGVEITSEPHVIFEHDDDTLGPAGTDEWMAFFTDPEGSMVGLVEQRARS